MGNVIEKNPEYWKLKSNDSKNIGGTGEDNVIIFETKETKLKNKIQATKDNTERALIKQKEAQKETTVNLQGFNGYPKTSNTIKKGDVINKKIEHWKGEPDNAYKPTKAELAGTKIDTTFLKKYTEQVEKINSKGAGDQLDPIGVNIKWLKSQLISGPGIPTYYIAHKRKIGEFIIFLNSEEPDYINALKSMKGVNLSGDQESAIFSYYLGGLLELVKNKIGEKIA